MKEAWLKVYVNLLQFHFSMFILEIAELKTKPTFCNGVSKLI